MGKILTLLIVIWLLIGAYAGYQRGYYTNNSSKSDTCAGVGTIALNVLAGPLNYTGVDPHVGSCANVPKPSKG